MDFSPDKSDAQSKNPYSDLKSFSRNEINTSDSYLLFAKKITVQFYIVRTILLLKFIKYILKVKKLKK